MSKSREQRLITKEHIATHTNLILLFKIALDSSTIVIKLFNSKKLFYAEILTVPSLISFTTCMVCPLLKLKRSVLLVMYNWLNSFYCKMNGKYTSLAVTHDTLHY